MPYVIGLIAVVAAIVVWVLVRRSGPVSEHTTTTSGELAHPKTPTSVQYDGGTAIVTFDVRVPDVGPDPRLAELLTRAATEAVRAKGSDVERISIRAWKGGHFAEVAATSLETAAVDDGDSSAPEATDFDPLGDLRDRDFGGSTVARVEGELAPIGKALSFTDGVRQLLIERGLAVESMTLSEMTLALLDATGYTVTPGGAPDTYDARTSGSRTFLAVVDHEKGGYPELDESAIDRFVIQFMKSGAERGLLFTDKYGPFSVYDKERRQPKIRFITRERLQVFVDSIAMR